MDIEANTHHLVLGQLNDFITGDILADTLDERYRQTIAKKLVMDKRYTIQDIVSNFRLAVTAGKNTATLKVDFLINLNGKTAVLIKYAPGSIVTRRLSTLALSRIVVPYQIPVVVVTNGEEAEILDGSTGTVIGEGLDQIPFRDKLAEKIASLPLTLIDENKVEKASRIAYACEIDGACPCDTDICVIEGSQTGHQTPVI